MDFLRVFNGDGSGSFWTVGINVAASENSEDMSGLRQGSILGPLLFLL